MRSRHLRDAGERSAALAHSDNVKPPFKVSCTLKGGKRGGGRSVKSGVSPSCVIISLLIRQHLRQRPPREIHPGHDNPSQLQS